MSSDPEAPIAAPVQAPVEAKPPAAYHHGDLRAALVQAAREALETAPPEAVTLKSLALRLGVSQPAPYRHFASREALMAAVAADGFDRFREALAEAAARGPAEQAFERACLAYVAYGQANMGVYRLMFASGVLHGKDDAPLGRAAQAAFDFLLRAVAERAPGADAEALAVALWSSLHGMVMLQAEGLLAGPLDGDMSAERIVRALVRTIGGR